jgi:hypothetical protein
MRPGSAIDRVEADVVLSETRSFFVSGFVNASSFASDSSNLRFDIGCVVDMLNIQQKSLAAKPERNFHGL